VRLVSHFECDNWPIIPISCKHKIYFDVLQYYGESVAYNQDALLTGFTDFTERTKNHYIGLLIVADTFGKVRN